jgi:hypothetical protein
VSIHETVRKAQETLAHFRGMYMRVIVNEKCQDIVDAARPYNHVRIERGGKNFWTASEYPLIPPKSLGEVCLDVYQTSLCRARCIYSKEIEGYKFPIIIKAVQDQIFYNGGTAFVRVVITPEDVQQLRLAMYHKEKI